jgi:hypothetical protein
MTQAHDPAHAHETRVNSVTDMSDASVACAALGRHIGFGVEDPLREPQDGWGEATKAERWTHVCMCGRRRAEVVDTTTGTILSRTMQYGGGELLYSGKRPPRDDARREYAVRMNRRRRKKKAKVTELFQAPAG